MKPLPMLPLLQGHRADSVLAWWRGRAISAAEFLHHVQTLARQLPEGDAALNLCEDRYLFLVSFAALLLRGQVNLLPPSRAPQVVAEVAAAYGDCGYLAEQALTGVALEHHGVALPDEVSVPAGFVPPLIPAGQLAAVLFTSGSTGRPNPSPKRWGNLVDGSAATRQRFGLDGAGAATVVATVPSQHMFGLETTVLLPLLGGLAVYGGRPFFPEDVRRALAAVPAPRILLTTPLHLRACVEAGIEWPALQEVICSTAPLPTVLAERAETTFGCPVEEIYGSTETGAIASRRTAQEEGWRPLAGVVFAADGEGCRVNAPFLSQSVVLSDHIALGDDGTVQLLGRDADMVNIAGKRASLADLTHKLLQIDGVEDGVIVQDEGDDRRVGRLCALVVAPRLDAAALQQALLQCFDPVFIPRPLYRVDRLPRNDAGKLPRAALRELLEQIRTHHGAD